MACPGPTKETNSDLMLSPPFPVLYAVLPCCPAPRPPWERQFSEKRLTRVLRQLANIVRKSAASIQCFGKRENTTISLPTFLFLKSLWMSQTQQLISCCPTATGPLGLGPSLDFVTESRALLWRVVQAATTRWSGHHAHAPQRARRGTEIFIECRTLPLSTHYWPSSGILDLRFPKLILKSAQTQSLLKFKSLN